MGVVVDTCVWVDVERGRLAPARIAEEIGDEPVYLTPVVLAEMRYGVERAASAAQKLARENALNRLRRKPCLVVDADTGDMAARVAAHLDSRGRPSQGRLHDLWIAASALQHGYLLLTRNAADFQDIPGLKVVVV